ncbi:nephrin-like isoform X2 [Amphibalanus amphitrite]|uniref:nephrin-like isoform X2 n=1 Tax=Amphibalanus amphitrite TaxID=1232801 RepID=UPI001C918A14|nr:nephrin-like isoform X2 [Amphibalanus amphitrite]
MTPVWAACVVVVCGVVTGLRQDGAGAVTPTGLMTGSTVSEPVKGSSAVAEAVTVTGPSNVTLGAAGHEEPKAQRAVSGTDSAGATQDSEEDGARDRRALRRMSPSVTVRPLIPPVPLSTVVGLAGGEVALPCDMSHSPGDTVLIVLWYRNGSDAPVYSYDLRNAMETDRRWHNTSVFGSRVDFVPGRRPAVLTLRDLGPADQAIYKCRVDFQHSRTRNALVNLTVIVPPESVEILDAGGAVLNTVVGAFLTGERLELTCRVKGGSPRPAVTWRSGGAVLPVPYQPQGEYTVSQYSVEALDRSDLHRMVTCLASNTNLTAPATSSVMIDMNFAPLSVSILGKGEPLSAGRRYPLVCQCVGSRPPAAITWFLGSSRMATAPGTTTHKGNVTLTTLQFTPRPEDDQKVLFCRCQNPKVPSATLEDSWQIVVQYLPRVTVTLGNSLDPAHIKEGDGVYFECSIRANPPVYKTEWRHNNRLLEHSVRDNIIISNYTLVLQDVKRSSSGVYMCIGFNVEGDAESNPIFLDVKFAPVCRPDLPRIYGVSKKELVTILCDVDSNPSRIHFLWTFNNTSEWRELDSRLVNSSQTRSTLRYRPRTEMDYGTVFCWATNDIGRMARPCVFHIIAAGPPDPLYNCSVFNRTAGDLSVRCLEAFDGGLVQSFVLHVYSAEDDHLVYNKTSSRPEWHVQGLIPTQRYRIQAVSQNDKGRSATVTIPADTMAGPEKQQENKQDITIAEMLPEPAESSPPMLAILVGVVGSVSLLLLAALTTHLLCRRGHRRRARAAAAAPASTAAAKPQVKTAAAGLDDDDDEKGPDVVPEEGDSTYGVYRIPENIPALPARAQEPAAPLGSGRRNGDIPLRSFNHIVPMEQCMQHGAATLPPPHRRPPRRPSQGATATVDRRRAHGPPPPRLEDARPPDAARSPMIGGRHEPSALIGYGADEAALIGCRLDESAF